MGATRIEEKQRPHTRPQATVTYDISANSITVTKGRMPRIDKKLLTTGRGCGPEIAKTEVA